MIKSPVFWQLGSNNCKFELTSADEISIPVSKASSGFIDQKSTALISSLFTTSTSQLEPPSTSKLINDLSLKSFTTNPVLNLFNPSASLTWNAFVSNSRALNDVNVSRFSILFSNAPISRIVNLRLSRNLICGSVSGSYRYGGKSISAISIESLILDGGAGFSEDSPL